MRNQETTFRVLRVFRGFQIELFPCRLREQFGQRNANSSRELGGNKSRAESKCFLFRARFVDSIDEQTVDHNNL